MCVCLWLTTCEALTGVGSLYVIYLVMFSLLVPSKFPLWLLLAVYHVVTVLDMVYPVRGDPLVQPPVQASVVHVVLRTLLG